MLTLDKVTRRYPGSACPAVDGVSLEVSAGEILAIIGESGSGKTTLLRLIAGLEYPDAGTVDIAGQRVADAEGKCWVPAEKRQVGFVFQDGALFPHLTVAANVSYGLGKQPRSGRVETVRDMLALVGLDGYQKRYPHELSGGERQRIAVARALAPNPKLILLDEPFSNLDPALRRSLREEIVRILAEAQTTAIMVTHDTDDALAAGGRIAVFRGAQIEQIGTPAEVYANPRNAYCAQLFGPANLVTRSGGTPEWIRPEKMRLSQEGSEGTSSVRVRLLSIRDAGRHIEATVKPEDPEQDSIDPWIINLQEHPHSFSNGDSLWVTFD